MIEFLLDRCESWGDWQGYLLALPACVSFTPFYTEMVSGFIYVVMPYWLMSSSPHDTGARECVLLHWMSNPTFGQGIEMQSVSWNCCWTTRERLQLLLAWLGHKRRFLNLIWFQGKCAYLFGGWHLLTVAQMYPKNKRRDKQDNIIKWQNDMQALQGITVYLGTCVEMNKYLRTCVYILPLIHPLSLFLSKYQTKRIKTMSAEELYPTQHLVRDSIYIRNSILN